VGRQEGAGLLTSDRIGLANMRPRVLIFDIGGTVFDWNTAVVETLDRLVPSDRMSKPDRQAFALSCRAQFMELNGAIMRGEKPWLTADEILATVMEDLWEQTGLQRLAAESRIDLTHSWRRMPAWPGAREAIGSLRERYIVAPLTILSWPMAVCSSRRNGISWDSILSCDILGIYKPDPRCYSRAAEIVDCAPGEMMMVAAHPSDLRAGIAAGYRSAYVVPRLEDPGEDYTDTGFAKEFDVVAQDFAELVKQLS
jgi:2-haloacid dehalogenase